MTDHHLSFLKRSFSQSSLFEKLLTMWVVPAHSLRDWQSRNASSIDPMKMWNPPGTLSRWYFSFTSRTYLAPCPTSNKSSNYFTLPLFRNFFLQSSPHWLSSLCWSTHPIMSNNHQSKDGFTGTLTIGDRLFLESIDLGLGTIVTADNIEELTSIFTNEPVHFVNTI
jgi:hypothetical protein